MLIFSDAILADRLNLNKFPCESLATSIVSRSWNVKMLRIFLLFIREEIRNWVINVEIKDNVEKNSTGSVKVKLTQKLKNGKRDKWKERQMEQFMWVCVPFSHYLDLIAWNFAYKYFALMQQKFDPLKGDIEHL